ncbi:MAG: peptidase S10 [Anaerolineae bacterium CFX3]|nr:peptidase S10 [Anaerolineae bacterium CFX3]MCQ3947577.1 peptidase S10 [Anaerolineae bacterium]
MPDKPEPRKNAEKKDEKPSFNDNLVVTKHSIAIGGREIKYTVTAGTMVLKEETADREKESEGEKPRAQVFFIAYVKDGARDKSKRPLAFSFNGGPGSASVWLHLGVLGPRRAALEFDGSAPPPPFKLTDNEYSLLDETDLVFIDPVSTGYSRPVEGQKPVEWHGFKKDIESVGDFIRLYTTRFNRWLSPKFIIGESYGTTRAAGLSEYLYHQHGMALNGVMLISSILDFGTADFTPGNDLPYILFVPGYAATAWYHDAVKGKRQTLQEFTAEAAKFALGEYASALLQGDALPAAERSRIVEKLSHYTGISPAFIERSNLRIMDQHYFKELLRERGLTVGRLDSRFTGRDKLGVGEFAEFDPLFPQITGPYTAAFYDYVRNELKFESDLKYVISGWNIVNPWSYAQFENQHVSVSESLRKAMTLNPYMKVFVANGYYDLGTPYFATEYTFNHLGLHESLRGNIRMAYYEAGHMMYIHIPSLEALKRDLAEFIRDAIP